MHGRYAVPAGSFVVRPHSACSANAATGGDSFISAIVLDALKYYFAPARNFEARAHSVITVK